MLLAGGRRTLQPQVVDAGCAGQLFCHVSLEVLVAQQFVTAHHRPRTHFLQQHFVAAGYTEYAQLRGHYSGCGRLSTAIAERGISVKAYEAYPKEGYRREHDMSIKSVIDAEIAAAERGEIVGAQFEIVCSSWSVFSRLLNGGTRSREKPAGNGALHREIVGNEQARLMFRLINVLGRDAFPTP